MEEEREWKRLRRYYDEEIREFAKEAFLAIARVYVSEKEAQRRWERLPEVQKIMLQEVAVSVYRQTRFADTKEEDTQAEIGVRMNNRSTNTEEKPRLCGLYIDEKKTPCQNIATHTIPYKDERKIYLCEYHFGLIISFVSLQEQET